MSAESPSLDPVCGMTVKPDGPHAHDYRGVIYRFCSARCLEKFSGDPESYLGDRPEVPARSAAWPSSR
jgi:Cu+-exporting ATPase